MKKAAQLVALILLISLTVYSQKRESHDSFEKPIPNRLLQQIPDDHNGIRQGNPEQLILKSSLNDDFLMTIQYNLIWDYSESVWEHNRYVTYTYNDFNNPIEKFESWTNGSGPIRKTDCSYDENQNLSDEYTYDYENDEWENSSRNLYNYDGNNNQIQKTRQVWDGEEFNNEIKSTYAYDGNNNKIYQMMYYWDEDVWVESQEFDYQYDENGNLYKIESEAWIDDEWVKWQKSIYAYDTTNLLLSIESSLWDTETSSWFHPHHKQLYTYDQDDNRIIFIIQGWNEYDEFWFNQFKTTYYYLPVGNENVETIRTNINMSIEDFQTTEDDIVIDPGKDDKVLIGVEVLIDSVLHTSDGDLEFTLSHNDISETIIYQVGGDGDNFIRTKLSDQGVDTLANGIAPFYGIYKPENPLSSFLDIDPSGTWTLSIYDGVAGNTGTLHAWGINLIYAPNMGMENELAEGISFEIFPNPAKNKFDVRSAMLKLVNVELNFMI